MHLEMESAHVRGMLWLMVLSIYLLDKYANEESLAIGGFSHDADK